MTNRKPRAINRLFLHFLLFLFTAAFIPSRSQNAPALNSMVTRMVVDSLVSQVNKYYVSKEAAARISAALKKRYEEGRYNRVEDPYALAGLLTVDVYAVHRDEHFHVEYNPALASEVSGEIEDVPKMVAEKLEQEKARNYGFKKAEVLPGNIGYLEISSFSRLNRYSKSAADAALRLLSGTRALIIDLRYGRGGSPDMVAFIASHFFKGRTHIADIYIRSENVTLPYWTTPDSAYGNLAAIPIYILTSYKTFSAAEGLAYSLKSLKRATIVGEVTRGGAHTVTYKPLSSGFVADIPFGRVTDPVSKTNWEGKGVTPDMNSSAEKALEAAELAILEKAMAAAKDSSAYKSMAWQLQLLQSINHPYAADSMAMTALTGVYGSSTISLENGVLYFQKPGTARLGLLPMSPRRFRPQGSDAFVLEFAGPESGRPRLLILSDDGRKEMAEKQLK